MDKIRLAYFTSLREIIGDEGVGTVVIDKENGHNFGVRTGNLEFMAREIAAQNSPFAEQFELAMVFCDDSDGQYAAQMNKLARSPFDVEVPVNGTSEAPRTARLENLLLRISSEPWRKIRMGDPRHKEAKTQYEERALAHLREFGIDMIVSDSYLSLFESVLLDGYRNRILNIHPAITDINSPYRLPGVTPTRDAHTRAKHGFIIVDDKAKKETWPPGEAVDFEFRGEKRKAVAVPKYNITGVTVHVVDEMVDHGPVVHYTTREFDPNSTMEAIRDGSYRQKLPLLQEALLMYAAKPEVRQLIEQARHNQTERVV